MQIPLQSWNNISCEQERKHSFFFFHFEESKNRKLHLQKLTQSSFDGILVFFFLSFPFPDYHLAGNHGEDLISIPSPAAALVNQQAGMHSPPPRRASLREFSGTYESLPARSVQVNLNRNVLLRNIKHYFANI